LVRYRRTRDLPFNCNLGVDASPAHPASPASLAYRRNAHPTPTTCAALGSCFPPRRRLGCLPPPSTAFAADTPPQRTAHEQRDTSDSPPDPWPDLLPALPVPPPPDANSLWSARHIALVPLHATRNAAHHFFARLYATLHVPHRNTVTPRNARNAPRSALAATTTTKTTTTLLIHATTLRQPRVFSSLRTLHLAFHVYHDTHHQHRSPRTTAVSAFFRTCVHFSPDAWHDPAIALLSPKSIAFAGSMVFRGCIVPWWLGSCAASPACGPVLCTLWSGGWCRGPVHVPQPAGCGVTSTPCTPLSTRGSARYPFPSSIPNPA
jgi:hypothetical protein